MMSTNPQQKIHHLVPRRKASSPRAAQPSPTAKPIANRTPNPSSEITPDKSPQNSIQPSSSSEESQDERSSLISQIDVSKLSPGKKLHNLSNYELLRLRNIQRNEAKLASLGLVGLTTKKKPGRKPKPTNNNTTNKANNSNNASRQVAINSPYVFPKTPSWHSRLHELRCFKSTHGHISVPKSQTTLNGWVYRQKVQYRNYLDGKKSSLDEGKVELLREVGAVDFWFGSQAAGAGGRQKNSEGRGGGKSQKLQEDEEEIGSIDSYSEDAVHSPAKLQRELDMLRSPKWMDGYSDEETVGRGEKKTTKPRRILNDNDDARGEKGRRREERQIVKRPEYSEDESVDDKVRGRRGRSPASKNRKEKRHRAHGYSDDDYSSDHEARSKSRERRERSTYHPDEDYDSVEYETERSKRGSLKQSKSSRRNERRRSSGYSDDESVEHDNVRRTDWRTPKKHRGHSLNLNRDTSDNDEAESKRRRSSSTVASHSAKKQKRLTPPKPRNSGVKSARKASKVKSTLEMIEDEDTPTKQPVISQRTKRTEEVIKDKHTRKRAETIEDTTTKTSSRKSARNNGEIIEYVGNANKEHSSHRSAKKKGERIEAGDKSRRQPTIRKVASKESNRSPKRLHKESTSNYYSDNGYDSDTSESYSTTSSSSVSTTPSSKVYHTIKPLNEVVITQSTKRLHHTPNKRQELNALLAERREVMMEYDYLFARNMERMRIMPQMMYELKIKRDALIQSGSRLFDKFGDPDELLCKGKEDGLVDGSLWGGLNGGGVEKNGVGVAAGPLEANKYVKNWTSANAGAAAGSKLGQMAAVGTPLAAAHALPLFNSGKIMY